MPSRSPAAPALSRRPAASEPWYCLGELGCAGRRRGSRKRQQAFADPYRSCLCRCPCYPNLSSRRGGAVRAARSCLRLRSRASSTSCVSPKPSPRRKPRAFGDPHVVELSRLRDSEEALRHTAAKTFIDDAEVESHGNGRSFIRACIVKFSVHHDGNGNDAAFLARRAKAGSVPGRAVPWWTPACAHTAVLRLGPSAMNWQARSRQPR
jgi:hypothetical protein